MCCAGRMNRRATFFSVLTLALVASVSVVACEQADDVESLEMSDVAPSDAPDDDPDADDAEGLESPEEAAVSGTETIEDDLGALEIDGDVATPLAARRVGSPVPGHGVTYPYGVRNPRYAAGFHTGQDHAAPKGRAVVAVRSGRIRWSNDRGGAYGRWIGLDANNGRTYVYCHLSARRYKAGRVVKAGERIGRVGESGQATGPHLHFEDHPKGPFRYAQVRKPRW